MDPDRYELREFRDADCEALAELQSRVLPDRPYSATEVRHYLQLANGPRNNARRLCVIERHSEALVGFGALEQLPFNYHPDKYWTGVEVDPDHRSHGIGSALFELLEREARDRGALALWAVVRSDQEGGVRFFQRQGFQESRRVRMSIIQIRSMALTDLPDRATGLAVAGIRWTTLAAEGADVEEVRRRYFRLHEASTRDMPTIGERTSLSFEQFLQLEMGSPGYMPEATFLARVGEEYVGVTTLERQSANPRVLRVGYTGTDPRFRGRGIATELKRRSLEFARDNGFEAVETGNDFENARIWAINEHVGFRTIRALINGEKALVTG
jgi:mycothiol synthase